MNVDLLDRLPGTGSYEWRADEDRVTWSPGLLAIFGLARPPANERAFNALVHPADRARIEAANSRLVQGGDSYVQEYPILRPDGEIRLIHDRGVIERDAAGRAALLRGINIDITGQRGPAPPHGAPWPPSEAATGSGDGDGGGSGGGGDEPAESPAQASALTDAIFDEAPVGIGVWDLDFRYLRVNDRLAEMNGLPAHAHIGRRPDELLPGVAGIASVYRIWQGIIDSGKPHLDVPVEGETSADPGRIRHWREHFFPVRTGGRIAGIAAVVEDVTERRTAQDILRTSEERLRSIIDNTLAFIALLDRDGRVREANAAALAASGTTREQVLGGRVWDIPPWNHAREVRAQVEAAVRQAAEGTATRFDTTMRQSDGSLARVDLLVSPLREPGGRVAQIVCSGFDITAREAANEHVRFLMQELGHRSKNLLALVQAVARQLGKSHPADFVASFTERIQAVAAAVDVLVEGDWKGADLDSLARSQLGHFAHLIGDRIVIDGPPLVVNPRAAQTLGMAFYELATNAGKHGALSGPDGRIALTWEVIVPPAGPGRLVLTWRESGGPPVVVPARAGFGQQVIGPIVEQTLRAEVALRFDPDGLSWRVTCPLEAVREN